MRDANYIDINNKMEIIFADKNGKSISVNTGVPTELTMTFKFNGEQRVMQIPVYDIYKIICKPNHPFMISE